ncbi:hypothetical protein [Neisseria elongata]|uniref:hypothetical protein n=1 Tax=Neisseria elongata TaxID=495 RepID=UPI0013648F9E|nr:hypothetical protein [Neisseria elongata]
MRLLKLRAWTDGHYIETAGRLKGEGAGFADRRRAVSDGHDKPPRAGGNGRPSEKPA